MHHTDYISKISNSKIDHGKDRDVVMPTHNLIEYSDIIEKHQDVYVKIIEMKHLLS